MRISKARSVVFLAIAALATLAACDRGSGSGGAAADDEAKALHIYEVPPAQLQSTERALSIVLSDSQTGSVPSSHCRLVVLDPASTQASNGKSLAASYKPPAHTAATRTPPN